MAIQRKLQETIEWETISNVKRVYDTLDGNLFKVYTGRNEMGKRKAGVVVKNRFIERHKRQKLYDIHILLETDVLQTASDAERYYQKLFGVRVDGIPYAEHFKNMMQDRQFDKAQEDYIYQRMLNGDNIKNMAIELNVKLRSLYFIKDRIEQGFIYYETEESKQRGEELRY